MSGKIPTHAEVPVIHLNITSTCRRQRGDMGAFDEAARRAREEYEGLMASWPLSEEAEFHLKLVVKFKRKGTA